MNELIADYSARATGSFMRESDPELAKAALPTFIKIAETMYSGDERNPDAALTVASLYIMYANAFIQEPASMLPIEEYELQAAENARAAALYTRAARILAPFISTRYPDTSGAAPERMAAAVASMKKADVPMAYWYAAAVFARYSLEPTNADYADATAIALELVRAADRVDPAWNGASVPSMLMSLYPNLGESMGGGIDAARAEYQKARELAGDSAGLYVGYAQAICVPTGDYRGFIDSLEAALAIVPDGGDGTLMTVLAQRKAAWLLARVADYFRIPTGDSE